MTTPTRRVRLYPSLMAAPQAELEKSIKSLDLLSDGFHIDIMDGHFVHNTAFDRETVNAIAQKSAQPSWVHLMVQDPLAWVNTLTLRQHSLVSFHYESITDHVEVINAIVKKGWLASLALKPKTPAAAVGPLLKHLTHILIMTVEPGFSGQPFIPGMSKKITETVDLIARLGARCRIGVDGGINRENIQNVIQAGAHDIALGAALFQAGDPALELQELRTLCS